MKYLYILKGLDCHDCVRTQPVPAPCQKQVGCSYQLPTPKGTVKIRGSIPSVNRSVPPSAKLSHLFTLRDHTKIIPSLPYMCYISNIREGRHDGDEHPVRECKLCIVYLMGLPKNKAYHDFSQLKLKLLFWGCRSSQTHPNLSSLRVLKLLLNTWWLPVQRARHSEESPAKKLRLWGVVSPKKKPLR